MFFINILLRLSRFKEMTWFVKWVTKMQTGININSWHKLNFFLRITVEKEMATPLQYSCLENPMDGGAWWATVHGVAKGRTQLSDLPCLLRITDLWRGIWGFGTVKDYFFYKYYYHYCSVTKSYPLVSYKRKQSGYFYLRNCIWMVWCPINNVVQWKQSEGLTLNPLF